MFHLWRRVRDGPVDRADSPSAMKPRDTIVAAKQLYVSLQARASINQLNGYVATYSSDWPGYNQTRACRRARCDGKEMPSVRFASEGFPTARNGGCRQTLCSQEIMGTVLCKAFSS